MLQARLFPADDARHYGLNTGRIFLSVQGGIRKAAPSPSLLLLWARRALSIARPSYFTPAILIRMGDIPASSFFKKRFKV